MPTLQSGDLIISKYCMGYLSGTSFETCDHRDTYISAGYLNTIEESITSGVMYAGIIILVISMLLGIMRFAFSRLFKR